MELYVYMQLRIIYFHLNREREREGGVVNWKLKLNQLLVNPKQLVLQRFQRIPRAKSFGIFAF